MATHNPIFTTRNRDSNSGRDLLGAFSPSQLLSGISTPVARVSMDEEEEAQFHASLCARLQPYAAADYQYNPAHYQPWSPPLPPFDDTSDLADCDWSWWKPLTPSPHPSPQPQTPPHISADDGLPTPDSMLNDCKQKRQRPDVAASMSEAAATACSLPLNTSSGKRKRAADDDQSPCTSNSALAAVLPQIQTPKRKRARLQG